MTHSYTQKNKVQLDPHHKKWMPLSKNAERTWRPDTTTVCTSSSVHPPADLRVTGCHRRASFLSAPASLWEAERTWSYPPTCPSLTRSVGASGCLLCPPKSKAGVLSPPARLHSAGTTCSFPSHQQEDDTVSLFHNGLSTLKFYLFTPPSFPDWSMRLTSSRLESEQFVRQSNITVDCCRPSLVGTHTEIAGLTTPYGYTSTHTGDELHTATC